MERLVGCRGTAGRQMEVRAWTKSTFQFSMGSFFLPTCKVLDQMAARNLNLNFDKIIHGCDAHNS